MYRYIIKPILFCFDPEWIHDRFIAWGEWLGKFSLTRLIIGAVYGYHGQALTRVIDGLHYRTPIILAAGFDYDGRLTQILKYIGFGGEEIGSVTYRPNAGNPAPRLTRLPKEGSIVVNKGLKNAGVVALIKRLQSTSRESDFVIGVSIARTNDQSAANTLAAGIKDYLNSFTALVKAGVGDYYTLNISCPNSYGGETFARPENLELLLVAIKQITYSKPIYVKLPINLPWPEFRKLLDIILAHKLNGVIIGNLNKNHSGPFPGSLSGKPCRELSTNLIRQTREYVGRDLTIIGCGGIFSPADAKEKLAAGADLLQLITGMIFEGPSLIKKTADSLA